MSSVENKLKKELAKLAKLTKEHKYFLNLAKKETNKNKKELILEYLKKLVNDMEEIKEKMEEIKEKIKIKNNANKEREAFKRKANSGFNTPQSTPPKKKSAKK